MEGVRGVGGVGVVVVQVVAEEGKVVPGREVEGKAVLLRLVAAGE